MNSQNTSHAHRIKRWLRAHLEVVLYGWFFFGMVLCGLLAPDDRVALLESSIVTEGWHLSVMAGVFGGTVVAAYIVRTRKSR